MKKIILATVFVLIGVGTFLVYSLAGLNAKSVVFAAPPVFVEQHATAMSHSHTSPTTIESQINAQNINDSEFAHLKMDFSPTEILILKVILGDESPTILTQLFTHPQKKNRVKIASALASVNGKLTHHEESGFADKREQFWAEVKQHLPDIENALYEALIISAQESSTNLIPYTLAWMPGQDHKTVEMLTWAAEHHPDWWIRRFSVYFVVRFGQNEKFAEQLVQSRTHDPDYRVRKQVLELRFKKFFGVW